MAYKGPLNSFFTELSKAIESLDLALLDKVSDLLYKKKEEGARIFFFGNGGSHSIATHLACDLGKGTKIAGSSSQKYYKAISLDNAAWLTAQANDGEGPFVSGEYLGSYTHGYDGVFVGQMENFLEKGDIAFAISSSGNSENVVNALLFAKSREALTIAMTGFDGGRASTIADFVIHVPTEKGKYGIVESLHSAAHHYLYERAISLEKEREGSVVASIIPSIERGSSARKSEKNSCYRGLWLCGNDAYARVCSARLLRNCSGYYVVW